MSEQEKRWPVGGYAPGDYTCKCTTCGQPFIGAKKATTCADCTIQSLLRRVEALNAWIGCGKRALAEAVYMLAPEPEDILKGTGIYRIVSAHVATGGVLPDDLMDALQNMKEKSDERPS